MTTRELSEHIRALIKRHEGLRLKPYRDTGGVWTVGYGHNLEATGEPIPDQISEREAEDLLERDLAKATLNCEFFIRGYDALDPVRKAVLVDMCFNMGLGSAESGKGLLSFRNTLALLAEGQYERAAENMLVSRWAEQVGDRAVEDARMISTGLWPEWIVSLMPSEPEPEPMPIPERKSTWGDAMLAVIHWCSRFFKPRA